MRVLVTRPQADAERTARALAERGHEAVLAPVLRIARTDEPPPAGAFDAVIVTSANAVPALASIHAFKELPVFAVGERTASSVAEAGCRNVRAASGHALSLANIIARTASPRAKLLLAAGRERKPEPHAVLSAAGFEVAVWVAYEAAAAERLSDDALRALQDGHLDAALHYSRRSASVLVDLVNDAGLAAELRALAHVCLSADVAAPLQAAGARRLIVAARPDETSLLTVLDECAEKSSLVGSRAPQSG